MGSAIETVSSVVALVKNIGELAKSLKNAELTDRVIELQSKVLEHQAAFSSLQQENAELGARNKQLEEALNPDGKVVYEEPVYWVIRRGERDGPFCPNCYDADRKFIHLNPGATKGTYTCTFHQATFHTADYQFPVGR